MNSSTLTLEELRCFLIEYEKQEATRILKQVSTLEDLQFRKGKIHAINVIFTAITNKECLEHFRKTKQIKEFTNA